MRALGMNECNLTPCDMNVVGADNANIKVLGAILVEFGLRDHAQKSKQILYICEGGCCWCIAQSRSLYRSRTSKLKVSRTYTVKKNRTFPKIFKFCKFPEDFIVFFTKCTSKYPTYISV